MVNMPKNMENFALCSPQDFEMLSKYSWYWSKGGYAMTLIKLDGKRKVSLCPVFF